jgi:hypothetical protein
MISERVTNKQRANVSLSTFYREGEREEVFIISSNEILYLQKSL